MASNLLSHREEYYHFKEWQSFEYAIATLLMEESNCHRSFREPVAKDEFCLTIKILLFFVFLFLGWGEGEGKLLKAVMRTSTAPSPAEYKPTIVR